MSAQNIRYIWGDRLSSSTREVIALKGVTRCAIYTAYLGKPESNVVRVYPRRMLVRGSINRFDKMDLSIRDIHNA